MVKIEKRANVGSTLILVVVGIVSVRKRLMFSPTRHSEKVQKGTNWRGTRVPSRYLIHHQGPTFKETPVPYVPESSCWRIDAVSDVGIVA